MRLGPGAIVAAAFIGPGTVTTAASAGVQTGIALLWAVLFSILTTWLLQELSLRCALATGSDLATLIRRLGSGRIWGAVLVGLVVLAIGVGNAAYQSGNLSGAGLGLDAAFGIPFEWTIALAALFAAVLIYSDRYALLERVLVMLVSLMAIVFVLLAILLLPDILHQPPLRLLPSLQTAHLTLVLALIGTTVVPYNLFLHATAARKRWAGFDPAAALREARTEARWAIALGGVVTAAVVIVASALSVDAREGTGLALVITAIEARFPHGGRYLLGGGLFAAGLSSAITAPVAAGWAVCGALGWSTEAGSRAFRGVALTVLLIGCVFALFATRPEALIITAQATNASLLPIIAILLLLVANSRHVPAAYRNGGWRNLFAGGATLLVLWLAALKLLALV